MDACSINYILDDIFISLQLLTMDMTDIQCEGVGAETAEREHGGKLNGWIFIAAGSIILDILAFYATIPRAKSLEKCLSN